MELDDLSLRLGLALAIGFVVGLERGWHERGMEEGARAAGVRTFSLIGLLGGVLGALSLGGDRLVLAAGLVTVATAAGAFMWREGERHKDFSVTSLVAAILTLVLGAYAVLGTPAVAAGAGVAAVMLLAYKKVLHGWLQHITWEELRSGMLLGAMTFIALPLLPNRTVDPWDALNPYELWLMTILIAAVSFAGYAAVKLVGPRRGLSLAAALGGLVTSTAVTLSLARLAKDNRAHVLMLAGSILASGCVMLLRVLVVAGIFNLPLAIALAPALLAAVGFSAVVALFLVRHRTDGATRKAPEFKLRNPFELVEVLRFGALLAVIMFAVVVVRRELGEPGLLGLSALSGLADVDALTLSVARLGEVTPLAVRAVLLTAAVNTAAKTVYAWVTGGARLGLILLLANGVTLAVGYAALVLIA